MILAGRTIGRILAVLALAVTGCAKEANKPLAPGGLDLDGSSYNETYDCSQTPSGGAPFCADQDVTDQVQFTKTGVDQYTVRDVPDTGFLYTGTLSGLVFIWTATSPSGYTESGTWTFSADGATFAGNSHYTANDATYTGDCKINGAKVPAIPAPPSGIGACP